MKHLAVALIVIAALAADFGANLWLAPADEVYGWDLTAGVCLLGAGWWFWHHRD